MSQRPPTARSAAPVGLVQRRLNHLALRTPAALAHSALRGRSPAPLEALAAIATGGVLGAHGLRQTLATGNVPGPWLSETRRPALVSAAVLLAAGGFEPGDEELATVVLDAVLEGAGAAAIHRSVQLLHVQIAFRLGQHDRVPELLDRYPTLDPVVTQRLRTDLANPYVGAKVVSPEAHRAWEQLLSQPFEEAGLSPLTVDPGAAQLFDGLSSDPVRVDHGPLTSVIMPCYRPDGGLVTSVRSMLAQTYQDLEVLVVDDDSGPEWAELFAEVESLDERVTLLRANYNGGSYLARNLALQHARGVFVTTQDADDWSHPERIARQVAMLLDEPLAAGCRSSAFRALDDLTHQWLGYSPRRFNASSLMVRRSAVAAVGPFDTVRRSADSEYHERLIVGAGRVVDSTVPMAITRLRAGTLSRGDFSYQWAAPERVMYRAMYRNWHRAIIRGEATLPLEPSAAHPHFPVPVRYQRGLPGGRALPERYDVLYVADLTRDNLLTAASGPHIRLDGSRRAAVMHLVDPTEARHEHSEESAAVLAAVAEGRADWVVDTDRVVVDTVVVLSPGVVEAPTVLLPDVQADRVLVVLDPPRGRPDVDLVAATDGARALFGRAPEWCAADADIVRGWGEAGLAVSLLEGVETSTRRAVDEGEDELNDVEVSDDFAAIEGEPGGDRDDRDRSDDMDLDLADEERDDLTDDPDDDLDDDLHELEDLAPTWPDATKPGASPRHR